MKSIFENLWNGNIVPNKECGKNDSELHQIAALIEKNGMALDDVLSEQQKQLLKNYMTCHDEYYYLMCIHAFRDGFSLACRLLTEALADG